MMSLSPLKKLSILVPVALSPSEFSFDLFDSNLEAKGYAPVALALSIKQSMGHHHHAYIPHRHLTRTGWVTKSDSKERKEKHLEP